MTLRRSLLWAASAALTILLIVLLIKISKLDLRVTVQQLRSVSWISFAKLVLLTTVHVYLSSQKWRCVDASLRRASDSAPSRTMSFALTSTGVALGQVLPVQLSMSAARTLGTYFHGRALKRGTGGTLFEQVVRCADRWLSGDRIRGSRVSMEAQGRCGRYARFPWPRWRFL